MKTNSQGKKATPAGLWPESLRTKGGTCRPWLIDGRGKAWSKRPDRQAGRHGRKRPPLRGAKTGTNHARPTSRPPAQPGACARHAGKVRGDRKAAKTVYQEEGRPAPCPKQAAGAAGRPQRRFQGQGKGQGRGSRSQRPSALNLSCFQEKQSVSNGKAIFVRRTTPPRPSPARGASRPLSSWVQGDGLRPQTPYTHDGSVGHCEGIKGLSRHILSRCAPCGIPRPLDPLSVPTPGQRRGRVKGQPGSRSAEGDRVRTGAKPHP